MNMIFACFPFLWLIKQARCENVLMVIGGQYFNASTRLRTAINNVEVLGPGKSCEVAPLPTPLYGMTAGLLGDTVYVCGGFHRYYRWQCYEYSQRSKSWVESTIRMENATGFPASVSDGHQYFIGGGREYVFEKPQDPWGYFSALRTISIHGRMENFASLPEALADYCLVISNTGGRRRLWAVGGSNKPQRYKVEVYAKNLDVPRSSWIKMPDLPDARMWQRCVFTEYDGQNGILVLGGYYNGISSMFLPLEDRSGRSLETFGLNRNMPRWEYVAGLTKERKWGPAVGFIGSNLVVAGGGDYGDETVDILRGGSWQRSNIDMIYKREFCVGVTLPQRWFPECQFGNL